MPELDHAPPRAADDLLESVLQRGHELRRVAIRRRQIGWLGRAAGVIAVAGIAASLAQGSADLGRDRVGSGEVASEAPDTTAGSTETSADPGSVPPVTEGTGAPGTSAPSTTEIEAERTAPLAVVEQRGSDGRYRTAVLHPGGTLVPVTAATAERQMPVLAPQGDIVAFQRRQTHPITGEPRWEVFTVRADGSGLEQITGGLLGGGRGLLDSVLGAGSRWPSWSPDGRSLAFSCSGPTGLPVICTSRADGSGRRLLTTEGQGFYQPTWSPDGRQLAVKREVGAGQVELWLLEVSGTAAAALPVPRIDPRGVRLSWSVDGTELIYAQVDELPFGLMVLDLPSGDQRFVPTPTPARFPVVCGLDQVLYLESSASLEDDRVRPGPLILIGADGSSPTTVLDALPGVEILPSSCAAR